jgi:hypothetical protein
MTSQKLYDILTFLDALDRNLKLQTNLEAIASALTNLVNQPATPQYQTSLANALAAFEEAAAQLEDLITPSQYATIEAMGGAEFFAPDIAEKVRTSVQKNAMTPSVAKDFVQEFSNRRAKFLKTVSSAISSLTQLNIKPSSLEPGTADLAFLIPREIFDNQLLQFAKELTFISRLLQHFSEAMTGEAEPVELDELSSSVPTVALVASAPVVGVIAFAVNKFLEAWEKIEKIRKLRAELADIGMKKTALDELTDQITTTVEEVVEETTATVFANYNGKPERKNELTNAIHSDTKRLFGQIERGLTVEFRAEPKKGGTPEEQKVLTDISELASKMQFPEIAKEPMLLSSGEIIEGNIQAVKHSKKTTTTRKTVSKKGTPSDDGGEVRG